MTTFGEWLKTERKRCDLTQMEAAEQVHCSLAMWRKMERDERRPSKQMVEQIANNFGISVAMLMQLARGKSGLSDSANQLPYQATPLIGRKQEVNELLRLLNGRDCRLLTLVGFGGVGKTRLGISVAEKATLPAVFVPLADAEDIIRPIATTCNIQSQPKIPLEETVLTELREQRLLLLLDNCEHLIDQADFLVKLLEQTAVTLLVTSRAALNLYEEWVFDVTGLSHTRTMQSAAVDLFVARAKRANVRFEPKRESAEIIEICCLVEGLPLAIELAAAWTRTLGCADIARALQNNIGQLENQARNVAPRHRSLEAVFNYSWELLDQAEQASLAKLTVFHGGFGGESAEIVTQLQLKTLARLVDKSLVRRLANGRYDLHAVIHELAQLRLVPDPQLATRHADYFLQQLQENTLAIEHGDKQSLIKLAADDPNLLAGWRAAADCQIDITPFAETLSSYCVLRGWLQEGLTLFSEGGLTPLVRLQMVRLYNRCSEYEQALTEIEAILPKITQDAPILYANCLHERGVVYLSTGQFEQSRDCLEQACLMFAQLDEMRQMARTQTRLFITYTRLGDEESAEKNLTAALSQLNSPRDRAYPLNYYGTMLIGRGHYKAAIAALSESRDLQHQVGSLDGVASANVNLAIAALRDSQFVLAKEAAHTALARFTQTDRQFGVAVAEHTLGEVARLREEWHTARKHYLTAQAIYEQINNPFGQAYIKHYLALVAAVLGDEDALALFCTSLEMLDDMNATGPIVTHLADIAGYFVAIGEEEKGARLAAFSAEHPSTEAYAVTIASRLSTALSHISPTVPKSLEEALDIIRNLHR